MSSRMPTAYPTASLQQTHLVAQETEAQPSKSLLKTARSVYSRWVLFTSAAVLTRLSHTRWLRLTLIDSRKGHCREKRVLIISNTAVSHTQATG